MILEPYHGPDNVKVLERAFKKRFGFLLAGISDPRHVWEMLVSCDSQPARQPLRLPHIRLERRMTILGYSDQSSNPLRIHAHGCRTAREWLGLCIHYTAPRQAFHGAFRPVPSLVEVDRTGTGLANGNRQDDGRLGAPGDGSAISCLIVAAPRCQSVPDLGCASSCLAYSELGR